MSEYAVEVSATAERQLRKLQKGDQRRVIRTLRQLAVEPRPRGSRKLRGYDNVYRVRCGRFRIIYDIQDRRLLLIVLKIGHRKNVYR